MADIRIVVQCGIAEVERKPFGISVEIIDYDVNPDTSWTPGCCSAIGQHRHSDYSTDEDIYSAGRAWLIKALDGKP